MIDPDDHSGARGARPGRSPTFHQRDDHGDVCYGVVVEPPRRLDPYAAAAGARATTSITARAVALVATKASNRRKAEVWVDGAKVATIDLYSSSTAYRQVVWQANWTTAASHVIQIRVLGTMGRLRFDFDALLSF